MINFIVYNCGALIMNVRNVGIELNAEIFIYSLTESTF